MQSMCPTNSARKCRHKMKNFLRTLSVNAFLCFVTSSDVTIGFFFRFSFVLAWVKCNFSHID